MTEVNTTREQHFKELSHALKKAGFQVKARDGDVLPVFYEDKPLCQATEHGIRYCNIALCQSNLCDNEKAFGTLDLIDESAARKSKSYHFVYAAIIVNSADTFKYGIAKQSLEAALKTDPRYHRAFLLRQYLNALMNCEDSKSNIDTLDAYFSEIVAENNDLKLIADYYMNRGLILLTYDLDSPAIENFEQAIEYGYDKTIASYNKYVAVYGQAVSGLPKDARVFFPIIDYSKMNLVISGLKDIIQDDSKLAQPYLSLKRRAIALYASACSLTRSHHDLTPLKDFLPLSCDDETTRTLILGSNEELSEDLVSTLPKSDQLFVHFRQLLDNNDLVTCKEEIIQIINSSIEEMSAPLYHLLLQTCIALETPEDFWKFEKLAISSGVTGFPILSLEACAYELEGNIEKAKVAFDEIAGKSCDYCILNNTIRFYSRNKYSKECEALYLKIQTLYEDSKIYIDDIDLFYREAILFFISQRSHLADYFIGKADTSSISSNVLLMLKAKLYSTINDIPRLKDCLAILINDTNSFQNRLNLAVCQCRLMDYAASMKTCQSLLEDSTDEREQIKVYWLVSDLFLFNDDKDESFVWANKAHDLTFQNPYDQSHQAFLGRALRCGHDEALSTVLEYKKTHPVVVNWLQPVSFDFENKNPIDSLEKAVEDVFPGSNKSYIHSQEIELLYRKGSLPFNQLLKNYNNNWWKIFLYATKNKLFLSLGDRNMLQAEQALIQEHILVDAQTLIVMSYFGCLPALQSIKHIHITYGSVEELQYSYLSWDHSCLHDLMRWIETADNLEFEADDFIDDDAVLSKVFSRNFVASCNYAHANNTPYLYLDALATAIQQNPDIDLSPEIPFVSIPSIVNHYGLTHPKERNEMLYRLLTGGTFISFSLDTIVDVISANNYVITEELMQPFLICKSDYDMMSFALVYLQALFELRFLHPECADSYANIILKDAARVWRRGSFYRDAASKWASIDAQTRSSAINKYVYKLIIGIKEIMAPSISADIVVLCDELEQSLMEHLADNFAKDSLETPASFAVNTREKDCHVKWGQ